MEKLEAFTLLFFLFCDKKIKHSKTGNEIKRFKDIAGHGMTLNELLNGIQKESHNVPRDYFNMKLGEENYKMALRVIEALFINGKITKKQGWKFCAIAELKLRVHQNTNAPVQPPKKSIKAKSKDCLRKAVSRSAPLAGEAVRGNCTAVGRPKMKGRSRALI